MSSSLASPKLSPLARSLVDFCQERALFLPDEQPLIALSGGADSCALVLLFCEAARHGLLPEPIGVAHFHHGMRGRDADADAGFCGALALTYGLPCLIGLGALAGANEAEAREARYRFLHDAAQELGASVIATGHHADDQAETVLLRAFRGTSVSGLAGIPARRENLIRPLLFARRAALESYCAQHGVAPRHDPTNDDPRFPRRKIRTLLPELAESFNPRLTEALCRLAEHAAQDSAYLDRCAQECHASPEQPIALPKLEALERPIRRRVLMRMLWAKTAHSLALREEVATALWVERLEALAQQGFGKLSLPGGLQAQVTPGASLPELAIVSVVPPMPSQPFAMSLSVPGQIPIPQSKSAWLRLSVTLASPLKPSERRRHALRIDCGTIPANLIVRTLREGDRIAPLGMGGQTRLVRDLLREVGVPAAARAEQLVVESDDAILWVVGVAQAENTRVPEGAERVLLLEVHTRASE